MKNTKAIYIVYDNGKCPFLWVGSHEPTPYDFYSNLDELLYSKDPDDQDYYWNTVDNFSSYRLFSTKISWRKAAAILKEAAATDPDFYYYMNSRDDQKLLYEIFRSRYSKIMNRLPSGSFRRYNVTPKNIIFRSKRSKDNIFNTWHKLHPNKSKYELYKMYF